MGVTAVEPPTAPCAPPVLVPGTAGSPVMVRDSTAVVIPPGDVGAVSVVVRA